MTTAFVVAYLVTVLALGYGWHRALRRAETAQRVADYRADALVHADATIESLGKESRQWHAMWRKANADADWARIQHAIVLGEIDRHDARHVCLKSLDGIRAARAEGGVVVDFPARGARG